MSVAPVASPVRVNGKIVDRTPLPVAFSWYFVSYSEDLKPGDVKVVQYFDQEWVLFRTEGGEPGMVEPYCPHLGAHLGHGGKVEGENLLCPFHNWGYDPQGWCKHIPYAKVMPPACKKAPILKALPMCEKNGIVWAWYHPHNTAPQWEIPEIPELHDPDFIKPARGAWPVNTFIQELGENGVDFAHLKYLHHSPIMPTGHSRPDGIYWYVDIQNGYIKAQHVGPGLQILYFTKGDVVTTMISYPSPITRGSTMMRMGFTHRKYAEGTPQAKVAAAMLQEQVGQGEEEVAGFESVDMIVWNNKVYRANPLLCDGDGAILNWRKWYSQFYVED
jgi:3-ketosteroid 9alpha-monooxygenase subunit A